MIALDIFKIKTIEETSTKGVFDISPLPRGYAQTLGNAFRRLLLSTVPGSAVTAIKFKGVQHEYTTLANVQDDLLAIVLRLRELPVALDGDEPVVLELSVKGKKGALTQVTAADFSKNSQVSIVDESFLITTLTDETTFDIEVTVERGVGYAHTSNDRRDEPGLIPLDADFSPIKNVAIRVEETRVEQQTDLDKLVLTIETNGSVLPSVAFNQSAQLLNELASNLLARSEEVMSGEAQDLVGVRTEVEEEVTLIREPIMVEDLDLSNRLSNALLKSGYTDLYQLEGMTDDELASIKGIGANSLLELRTVLKNNNINII